LFVFDLTDKESFKNVQLWYEDVLKTLSTDTLFVLIGNKADLVNQRSVSNEDAEAWAHEHGMPFFEASAKTSSNLDSILLNLAERHVKR
jgi:GTPase SAR1 family protein